MAKKKIKDILSLACSLHKRGIVSNSILAISNDFVEYNSFAKSQHLSTLTKDEFDTVVYAHIWAREHLSKNITEEELNKEIEVE